MFGSISGMDMFRQVRAHRVRRGQDVKPITKGKISATHTVHQNFKVFVDGRKQAVIVPEGAEVWFWQDPQQPVDYATTVGFARWGENSMQLTVRGSGRAELINHNVVRAKPMRTSRRSGGSREE